MKVAFLHDVPGYIGGAELTMRGFIDQAPKDVEVVDSLDCDAVVIGNSVGFGPELIQELRGKHIVRYFNDTDPHSDPELRAWLLGHAEVVFTSPLHRERFPHPVPEESHIIPPALDLKAFRPTRQTKRNGHRKGACSIGAWQNPGKGQQLLKEWSEVNELVDVYGGGPYVPHGPNLTPKGELAPESVAQTLWRYERFVHLPTDLEPFGRAVVEAWVAGCEVITNRLVGARHYIEENPEALETAAEDFWSVVCGVEVAA